MYVDELTAIKIKLAIINKVIQEARAEGLDVSKAIEQAQILNDRRAAILQAQDNPPPPVSIKLDALKLEMKGSYKNGRR